VDNAQQRSSLSFSLRSLLAAGVVLAAASIAAAPLVRSLTADQRRTLLKILLAMSAGAIPTAAIFIWARYRVERRRGKVLITLTHVPRVVRLLVVVILLAVMVFGPMYFLVDMTRSYFRAEEVARNANFRVGSGPVLLFAPMAGANVAMGLAIALLSRPLTTIEFCTNGIAWWAIGFVPWSAVSVQQSHEASGRLILLLKKNVLRLVVPPAEWPRIRDVLQEHVES
jgi:hypothetical protein